VEFLKLIINAWSSPYIISKYDVFIDFSILEVV